jgi:hypothetical protein
MNFAVGTDSLFLHFINILNMIYYVLYSKLRAGIECNELNPAEIPPML